MVSWVSLPGEIRNLILRQLALDASKTRKQKLYLFGKYASICKEWQAYLEPFNFKGLSLTVSALDEFDRVFADNAIRRKALQRVLFQVMLPSYSKLEARYMESPEEQDDNDAAFTEQLWHFFELLESWDPSQSSFELEILARSRKDERDPRSGEGGEARFEGSSLDLNYFTVPELKGPHGLPEVHVVSKLSILRRMHRSLAPLALLQIISSLPSLRELQFEPWEEYRHEDQNEVEIHIAEWVLLWPSSLKKVSLFSSRQGEAYLYELDDPDNLRRAIPFLSRNLAKLSTRLEEFSCCFLGDAQFFFEPFMKAKIATAPRLPSWANLTSLTLTSSVIHPEGDPATINDMLQAAGNAAKRMPKLRTMELWGAGDHHAGIFLYLVSPMSTTASWESTWKFKVTEIVKQTWRTVASQHTRYDLDFGREVLLRSYKNPEVFIHSNLATWDVVLHPLTSRALLKGKDLPLP